ncbi:hypothetical protein OBFLKGFO_02729 [Mannheimia haemolytica]
MDSKISFDILLERFFSIVIIYEADTKRSYNF